MSILIDTSVAIHFRDRQPSILEAVLALDRLPLLSVISQVELEGGVYARPDAVERRRLALDELLSRLVVLPFEAKSAAAYRGIVKSIGFSRPRIADRMIAATALAHGLTLVTINGKDFADIPGLSLTVWRSPVPGDD